MKDEEARLVIGELVRRNAELERYIDKLIEANGLKAPLKSTIGVSFDTWPVPKFWRECFGS